MPTLKFKNVQKSFGDFQALKNISLSSRGEYELPDAIMYLVKQGKVKVKTLQDEYVDLGMPKDVSKVEDYVRRNF